MPAKRDLSVPAGMRVVFDEIAAITDSVCLEHLDQDYAYLARKLAATLARKRPSPLERGRSDLWAAGIVYCLGNVNFLYDITQTPHLKKSELAELFGVSQRSAAARARQIWDLLNIIQMDPDWWRPSRLDQNPLAWYVLIDEMMVDARNLPLEYQEVLARHKIIPYVPGKRSAGGQGESGREESEGTGCEVKGGDEGEDGGEKKVDDRQGL